MGHRWIHGASTLSCVKWYPVESQGIIDIISRAFASAKIPATKKPSGLFRSDGKRPDSLTLIPWQRVLSLTWDVTVTTMLADSYISASASSAGAAAEMAASKTSQVRRVVRCRYCKTNITSLRFVAGDKQRCGKNMQNRRETSILQNLGSPKFVGSLFG